MNVLSVEIIPQIIPEIILQIVNVWVRVRFVFTDAPKTYWALVGLSNFKKKKEHGR